MRAIFKREVQTFFSSPVGYMVVGLFLVLNGLFLWVFKGAFNIFDYGFADLDPFFSLVPWVFLFLVPAITMRSFSEEKKLGTLELLLIKPVSLWELVTGKFLGAFTLVLIALLPTLLYVFCISRLGTTPGNLDMGVVSGSYFSTLFLVSCYTAIGLYASTFSDNQIIAFLSAVVLCFVLYYGFEGLGELFSNGALALGIRQFGLKVHFENISKGILDTRDLIYCISLTVFFLFMTVQRLKHRA